jgi:hypothetical protein
MVVGIAHYLQMVYVVQLSNFFFRFRTLSSNYAHKNLNCMPFYPSIVYNCFALVSPFFVA